MLLTPLGLQSRFGDNLGKTTWNLTGMSPKRDWGSKRVNSADCRYSVVLLAGAHVPGVEGPLLPGTILKGTYGADENLYIVLFLLLRGTIVNRTYGTH